MAIELKKYPCAVCGSEKLKSLYKVKGFDIVQCRNCDFVFVNPRIGNSELYSMYAENYFTSQSEGYGYKDYELTSHLRKKTFQKWIEGITPWLSPLKGAV